MFHTNSPVCSMLTTVSLRAPCRFWLRAEHHHGRVVVHHLELAERREVVAPARLVVEIQPMGRGTTQDLNGLKGRPCGVTPGS